MKIDNQFPKITALAGSIHVEWRSCGRLNCHCRSDLRHGPYYVRRWRQGSRQRKAYVAAADLPAVLLAVEAHRAAKVTRVMAKAVRKQVRAT